VQQFRDSQASNPQMQQLEVIRKLYDELYEDDRHHISCEGTDQRVNAFCDSCEQVRFDDCCDTFVICGWVDEEGTF
jgi:hypothetical protein